MLSASEERVGVESKVLGKIQDCFRVGRELAAARVVHHFTERETLGCPGVELEVDEIVVQFCG